MSAGVGDCRSDCFASRIYSSYINGFDDALARIQSWAKPTPSRSPLLPSPASPAIGGIASYDAAAGVQSTLSANQKKRIKSWLKVRSRDGGQFAGRS